MDKSASDLVKERLQSAFPAGTFAWVEVLEYGDDPAVEPGDTAVRAYIDKAARPDDGWDSRQTLADWADANSVGIEELHRGLLPSVAWVDFVPDAVRWALRRLREDPAYPQFQ